MSVRHGVTIVLCGGPLNPTNVPIGRRGSNAMVPINGKPVIGWIFDDLLAKGVRTASVVLRRENTAVAEFIDRAFGRRMAVTPVFLERDGSIVESLGAGLRHSPGDGPVRAVLGDTLVRDPFDGGEDFIYAGRVEDSQRWCIVETGADGRAARFFDKQERPGESHLAVAGYYHLMDRALTERCVDDAIAEGARELSVVLSKYGSRRPIAVRTARAWYDFGHVDNCVRAKRELLQSRFFNSLSVNPVLNTITKLSTDNEKLADELAWYLGLPEELKVLTPRIVSHRTQNGHVEIVQEYYGYPTLAELFVYAGLPLDAWRVILRHVLMVQAELRRHSAAVDRGSVIDMYAGKTRRRLDRLAASDPVWAARLALPFVTCNGQKLRNVNELWPSVETAAAALADTVVPGVVHGDLCFSNILFDFNNQIIRLIDPRGRFGVRGIGGDTRYDLAKLRHSAHGLYDFIVADMFKVEGEGDEVVTTVAAEPGAQEAGRLLDAMLVSAGHDLAAIQRIEGLLFLSMLPLHEGRPERQQMMYYTGLQILNEVL